MASMPNSHEAAAAEMASRDPVRCAVLTVSDTRTLETDTGGPRLVALLEGAGHRVIERAIVRDEPSEVWGAIEQWLVHPEVQVILTTGGTGIARRDGTVEVVRAILTAELEGFGELFRMLSWEQVGTAAMMSRAVGGLVARDQERGGDTFLFAMPGSLNAIETAMTLLGPQLGHLVWERRRGSG